MAIPEQLEAYLAERRIGTLSRENGWLAFR
jgi:hypothetical protein